MKEAIARVDAGQMKQQVSLVDNQAYVQVNDLTKVFFAKKRDSVEAIDDLSFSVKAGEFISILGPSGCGKSTLLKIVAGLITPTTGQVHIGGKEILAPVTNVGIVFQQPILLDWLTVIQNITLQIEVRKGNLEKGKRTAMDLLEKVGLKGFENKYPYELSGGMQQRVSICRALVHNPPLLLMDEPFGALDALTRDQMNLDLQRIWMASGKTVIFITHSMSEAIFLSDRVFVFTPRPTTIAEIVPVNLPRPRKLSIKETPEFQNDARRITDLLRGMGVLRDVDDE